MPNEYLVSLKDFLRKLGGATEEHIRDEKDLYQLEALLAIAERLEVIAEALSRGAGTPDVELQEIQLVYSREENLLHDTIIAPPWLDRTIEGSTQTHCRKCGQVVALAPTSVTFLAKHPGMPVWCVECASPEIRAQEGRSPPPHSDS